MGGGGGGKHHSGVCGHLREVKILLLLRLVTVTCAYCDLFFFSAISYHQTVMENKRSFIYRIWNTNEIC